MKSKLDLQLYQSFKSNKFHFSIGELESSVHTAHQYALTTKTSDRYALRMFATKSKHSPYQSNHFVGSENLKFIDTIKHIYRINYRVCVCLAVDAHFIIVIIYIILFQAFDNFGDIVVKCIYAS